MKITVLIRSSLLQQPQRGSFGCLLQALKRNFCVNVNANANANKVEILNVKLRSELSLVRRRQSEVNYSRFSANKIMTGSDTFRISDYDCIGFDLDNTVLRYNVGNMIRLEYETVSKFLVEEKGYSPKYLLQPIDHDFLQKGLIIDFHRGNVLKIGPDGFIYQATHGTKKLSDQEVVSYYGEERKWEITTEYSQNMLVAWNGPLSERLRTVLDYFDICSTLLFGRIVDTLDEKAGKRHDLYNIWPDVLDGLVYMYSREHFAQNFGGYFTALKENPEKFVLKTPPQVLAWLKQLKSKKTTFLITGSHSDFANYTASYALGPDWRDYFDVVICFAKKPGFFTGAKPFVKLDGDTETDLLSSSDLKVNEIYSQGNWRDLTCLLEKKSMKSNPKYLYVGDNLIQDVYTPAKYTKCDTIAILEEMSAEGMKNCGDKHIDCDLLQSKFWGSYFCAAPEETSIWADLIKRHSKICIPTLEAIAEFPLDHVFNSFTENLTTCNGYYPNEPIHLVK